VTGRMRFPGIRGGFFFSSDTTIILIPADYYSQVLQAIPRMFGGGLTLRGGFLNLGGLNGTSGK
jgi:hypothetical protein